MAAADLEALFQEAIDKASNASDIADLWANGDENTLISTTSGDLPSLKKFLFDTVGAGSFAEFEVDLSAGNAVVSGTDFAENSVFSFIGNTVARTVTFPSNIKLFYVRNEGTSVVTAIVGSTQIAIPPSITTLLYTDGSLDGLLNFFPEKAFNNLTEVIDPTTSNDETEGYSIYSIWINVSSGEVFRCIDATTGSAIWVKTTLTIDELGTLALGNNSSDVPYDNTISGLVSTNVKTAIDELQSNIGSLDTTLQDQINLIDQDIADLVTLSGVAENTTDLGTFSGTVIPDGITIKSALQTLETELETKVNTAQATAIAVSNAITFAIALG